MRGMCMNGDRDRDRNKDSNRDRSARDGTQRALSEVWT
jgi:hypothetical protein